MQRDLLNPEVKALLSARARVAVERAQRAGQAAAPAVQGGGVEDLGSPEGMRARIGRLEDQIERIGRESAAALGAMQFTLERLEARCAALSGELEAARAAVDRAEGRLEDERAETRAAAQSLAQKLQGEFGALVGQFEALARDVLGAQQHLIGLSRESGVAAALRRLGGRGASGG